MDLVRHVNLLGGAAPRALLVERWGRAAVDRALRDGVLVRVARGRYTLATASDPVRAAAALGGVMSMRSAAQRHGWGQKQVPDLPDVTFARTRHLPRAARALVVPHWSDLGPDDVVDGATSIHRTLVDCMRMLPFDEALAIVESALRVGDVTRTELTEIAAGMRGRGRTRAICVARMATARTANAYESTLRAIASTVPGLELEPQGPVVLSSKSVLHPDLVDHRLRIVIEAESFAWHGDTAALTRDCARYNALTAAGWIVVRFSWYQVMYQPAYVLRVLEQVVRLARRHANVPRGSPEAAA